MTKARVINDYEARRRQAGLTRQELADRLGVSKKTVENWEYGQTVPHPSARKFMELFFKHWKD